MENQQKHLLKPLYYRVDDEGKPIIPKKTAEEKQYLLLLYGIGSESDDRSFEIMTGRSNVLAYLATIASEIDLKESLILVESLPLEKAETLLRFIGYCLENGYVENETDKNTFISELAEYDESYEENTEAQPRGNEIVNNLYNISNDTPGKDI